MSTIITIALRNVLRHRRRALITAVVMMVGIGFFIGLDSVYNGLDKLSVDNLIRLRDSSVRIFTAAYEAERASYPLDYGITNAAAVEAAVKKDARVVAVAPRTRFLAQAGNGRDATYVIGTVIDPTADAEVFSLKDALIGSYFTPGNGSSRQVILGKELADRLGLKEGDTVILAASTRYGAQNADDFTVAGLLSTSDPSLNRGTVFITYDAANDFLDLGGLVTELDVRLEKRVNLSGTLADSASVAAGVKKAFPNLAAYSFQELNKGFLGVIQQKRAWSTIIMLCILLIAAVGIVNTILMSVYERVREVGVLKALGFRSRDVVGMFMFEGFFVGCLGSFLGAALGILIDCYTVHVGFSLQKLGGDISGGFAFWGTLHGEWNPGVIVFGAVFGMAMALAASFIPARSAARMTATAALRFA